MFKYFSLLIVALSFFSCLQEEEVPVKSAGARVLDRPMKITKINVFPAFPIYEKVVIGGTTFDTDNEIGKSNDYFMKEPCKEGETWRINSDGSYNVSSSCSDNDNLSGMWTNTSSANTNNTSVYRLQIPEKFDHKDILVNISILKVEGNTVNATFSEQDVIFLSNGETTYEPAGVQFVTFELQ